MTSINTEGPIRSWVELEASLERINQLMGDKISYSESEELDMLVARVEAYEAKYFPMAQPSLAARVQFRMEQGGYGWMRRLRAWVRRNDDTLAVAGTVALAIVGMVLVIWLIPGGR